MQSPVSPSSEIDRALFPRHPLLAFRVGVVGHRPNRLGNANVEKLAGAVRSILSIVKDEVLIAKQDCHDLYDVAVPLLRAISPLAEGTDRIFAEQALALGFEVCCVMPFSQAEFERDFVPSKALEANSLDRFCRLLARATTRFELDGCRADEAGAYGTAGRVVLNQSDLLIVVWDGKRKGKRGGTEETFDEARRRGLPAIWIDAHAPHNWQLLDATTPLPSVAAGQRSVPAGSNSLEPLHKRIQDALELPKFFARAPVDANDGSDCKSENPECELHRFYAEKQHRWTWAVIWKAFRDVVADGKIPKIKFSITSCAEAIKTEWPEKQLSPVSRLVNYLRPYYVWLDKLAVLYADKYRSAFISAFLLAAVAVGVAFLPIGLSLPQHHWVATLCIWVELGAILVISGLVYVGRRKFWHERWLQYRLTAELIRHLRLVAPLGGMRPFPQIPAHMANYGQPGATWMAWYARAIERALGLPSAKVNNAYLDTCLSQLAHVLTGQKEYHKGNANRSRRIEELLHRSSLVLIVLTFCCCSLHLLPPSFYKFLSQRWHEFVPGVLTFLCGFFPALGAALAGISHQGEFRRVTKRSEAMQEQLSLLLNRIEDLRGRIATPPTASTKQLSPQVAALAADAARLLVNETLDWRMVFIDQPLDPPA